MMTTIVIGERCFRIIKIGRLYVFQITDCVKRKNIGLFPRADSGQNHLSSTYVWVEEEDPLDVT